jgi:hypothetical protein
MMCFCRAAAAVSHAAPATPPPKLIAPRYRIVLCGTLAVLNNKRRVMRKNRHKKSTRLESSTFAQD